MTDHVEITDHPFEPYTWESERCGYIDGNDVMCGYNLDEHQSAAVDHWKARALDAESKLDGQAWADLTKERDDYKTIAEVAEMNHADLLRDLLPLVEAAKAWRAEHRPGPDIVKQAAAHNALVAAVDALNRGNIDALPITNEKENQ